MYAGAGAGVNSGSRVDAGVSITIAASTPREESSEANASGAGGAGGAVSSSSATIAVPSTTEAVGARATWGPASATPSVFQVPRESRGIGHRMHDAACVPGIRNCDECLHGCAFGRMRGHRTDRHPRHGLDGLLGLLLCGSTCKGVVDLDFVINAAHLSGTSTLEAAATHSLNCTASTTGRP